MLPSLRCSAANIKVSDLFSRPQRRLPDRSQPVVGGGDACRAILDYPRYWHIDRAVSSVIFLFNEINDLECD
jgi:hypothetical protein